MKKELAIILESLEGFDSPDINLEQYVTPPSLAAEVVVNAKLMDDLSIVVDLGCGTGILAIASSLLGARAIGFDIDIKALKIARKNAKKVEAEVEFVVSRIEDISLKKKVTVIMNPPFGIQKKYADRAFLRKAMEISNVIYTMHSAGTERYISDVCRDKKFEITHLWRYSIPLRRSYKFHEKDFKYIPVEVFRLRKKD